MGLKLAIIGSRGFPSTYGGYETLVRHLAQRWVEEGHSVTVYCRQRPAHGRRRWYEDGVNCVWTPGVDGPSTSTLSFGLTSSLHAATQRYDAALVLNIANGFYLPLLSARGIPTVVNTDGIEWQRGKWGPTARRVFYCGARMSARHANVLVCDSEAIGDIWRTEFGVDSRFIPYGGVVHEDLADDRVRALGLAPRSYVLVVARLIPENNVDLTINALELLPDSLPAVVVGSANYASPLEQRLRELDHRGTLRWLGHVQDQTLLSQLWAHCGVYVHGHSVGGTNPALLQALGAGAPTLALDTVFNAEVIVDSEQLYPKSVDALTAAISAIICDPERQRRWSLRGQARITGSYSWDRVCDSYLDSLLEAKDRLNASAPASKLGRLFRRVES
jgi:glycosyltransferase involved in cell wall biosynthesis